MHSSVAATGPLLTMSWYTGETRSNNYGNACREFYHFFFDPVMYQSMLAGRQGELVARKFHRPATLMINTFLFCVYNIIPLTAGKSDLFSLIENMISNM